MAANSLSVPSKSFPSSSRTGYVWHPIGSPRGSPQSDGAATETAEALRALDARKRLLDIAGISIESLTLLPMPGIIEHFRPQHLLRAPRPLVVYRRSRQARTGTRLLSTRTTNSACRETPVMAKTRFTCVRAVFKLKHAASAYSSTVLPLASAATTRVSAGVSPNRVPTPEISGSAQAAGSVR